MDWGEVHPSSPLSHPPHVSHKQPQGSHSPSLLQPPAHARVSLHPGSSPYRYTGGHTLLPPLAIPAASWSLSSRGNRVGWGQDSSQVTNEAGSLPAPA